MELLLLVLCFFVEFRFGIPPVEFQYSIKRDVWQAEITSGKRSSAYPFACFAAGNHVKKIKKTDAAVMSPPRP